MANDLPLLGVLSITGFWCLTSRVLITYVLPTVPFFAVWLADRLTVCGVADRAGFRKALCSGLAVVWCIMGVVFASMRTVGDRWVDKMPGEFFKQVAALVPDGQIYCYRRVPYSAYFYFGDRAILHADEDVKTSETASRPYCLVSKKRDLKWHPLEKPRLLLLENGVWALYAPAAE